MTLFKSILSRIVVFQVVAILILSVTLPMAVSWLLSAATSSVHDAAMLDQAYAIEKSLTLGADGQLTLELKPELQGLYAQPYGRYSYAVLDQVGTVLLSSRPTKTPLFNPVAGATNHPGRSSDLSGVSLPITLGGRDFLIQAGEDLSNRDALTDDITIRFFRDVGWITLPFLLALLMIDIVIFQMALRPLRNASAIAKEIGPTRTNLRLPVDRMPSEILPLLNAINSALDRLDKGFRLQKEFTADAAHELRTPLSVLRARVETISDKAATRLLTGDIDGMSRVIGQLLDMAELDVTEVGPTEVADLRAITVDVVSLLAPMAVTKDKAVALLGSAEPVLVKGNVEMLTRAIRNLAENALKYAPSHTTIDFTVINGMVAVRDRGPGVDDADIEHLFQRFWRKDRGSLGSSGLGLSIVDRVVQLHAGRIVVTKPVGGGIEFAIFLPTAK